MSKPDAIEIPGSIEFGDQNLSVTIATEAELDEVAAFEQEHFKVGAPYTREEYGAIFKIGEIIILRDSNGKMIAVSSLTYDPESQPKLHLTATDTYYSGSITAPEWRNQGLSGVTSKIREQLARAQGMERAFTVVNPSNLQSQRALEKVGFNKVEEIRGFYPPAPAFNDPGDRWVYAKDLPQE